MLTEQEALGLILEAVKPLSPQHLPLVDALHYFSAQPLHALVPLPGFDNSAMDGYALRAEDSQGKNPLSVIGEQPAGASRQLKVESGHCIRIFTGAPMPEGADAVIMQEDVSPLEGGKKIICNEPVKVQIGRAHV